MQSIGDPPGRFSNGAYRWQSFCCFSSQVKKQLLIYTDPTDLHCIILAWPRKQAEKDRFLISSIGPVAVEEFITVLERVL
jgi:hypothetical protein